MFPVAHKAEGNTMLMYPPATPFTGSILWGLWAFVLSVSKSTNAVLLLYNLSFKASPRCLPHPLSHHSACKSVSEHHHKAQPKVTHANPPLFIWLRCPLSFFSPCSNHRSQLWHPPDREASHHHPGQIPLLYICFHLVSCLRFCLLSISGVRQHF